jgi:KDO2-lipid IV(A) lauroyltransferase
LKLGALIYFIVLPFIYLLSVLPFPILYFVSDIFYAVLYYGVGYRKKVVLQNLRNAFPGKTEKEIQALCKKYFHYLCDLSLETFKTLTISKERMLKHCKLSPQAQVLFDKLADENRNFILVLGHLGNWEWSGNTFSLMCRHQLFVIYHPLENKHFNGLITRMRGRFGSKLIAMRNTYKDMLSNKGILSATAFIADQTPQPQNAYWTTFLNQDTPVFKGTEVIAKKMGYPVVYAHVKKLSRGYYEIFAEMLCEHPELTKDGELSEMHTKRLEKDIVAMPETWLWSHRRWKHKRPQNATAQSVNVKML